MLFWVGCSGGGVKVLERSSFPGFYSTIWVLFFVNILNVSDFYIVIVPFVLMFATGAFVAVMEDSFDLKKLRGLYFLGFALIGSYPVFHHIYTYIVLHIPFLWGASVNSEQVYRVIYLIAFPIFVIHIGKIRLPVPSFSNDYSYGVYIYGWPFAQILVYLAKQWNIALSPILYFTATMALTLPAAYLSWILIEKPCLSLKRK